MLYAMRKNYEKIVMKNKENKGMNLIVRKRRILHLMYSILIIALGMTRNFNELQAYLFICMSSTLSGSVVS